ncbi:alpha-L-fucosidase [Mucilaginibacter paludis]|nr:alpha-L-fucosidase [Mucilaginibacter paludis]
MKPKLFAFLFVCSSFIGLVSAQPGTSCFSANSTTMIYEAEAASPIGSAVKVVANSASGGNAVTLSRPGDGVMFKNIKVAQKLAIRYSSSGVGLIAVAVNGQVKKKFNIHSSGNLSLSFLNAITNIKIDAGTTVAITLITDNITVNLDEIAMGDNLKLPPDIWNLPVLPVASGPFKPDWKDISEHYLAPNWWREAKFGAWSHWDPQSMPEEGDWYSRKMYQENSPVYKFHVKTFGHPSEYGYKDIAHNWGIDRWDPEALMNLYVAMGARYFMAMGVHHDNFDNWNSAYQPWNSVNVGPKKDIVGIWEKTVRKHGLRFGIGFHNTPPRTWGQFMPVKYASDQNGPLKDVPYDGLQTIADGKGKWWEGMDPVDLYGPVHASKDDPLHSPFANQFMWRVDDAITKYHPDVIYFDEHAGDSQVDLGVHMGLGFLAPQLIANYYNKSLKWNHGKMEAVVNLKGVGGQYNSFQNSKELLPFVEHSLVKSSEKVIEKEISAYPFQTEESIAEWHYQTGQKCLDAPAIVKILMENVSRNGTLLLNLTQHGRGNLDAEVIQTARDIGAWLKINGEAIYGSRPFEVYGDTSVYYTRNKGKLYATLTTTWKNAPVKLKALKTNGATLGKVSKVELLGAGIALPFVQDEQGLTISPPAYLKPINGISNATLASLYRILRITHDKTWINDDDPGVKMARGWFRQSNLNDGDFNNDLTTSNTPGAKWSFDFIGNSISVIAPKQAGSGKIEVLIDGKARKTVGLSATTYESQQVVCRIDKLTTGSHTISVINRGGGPVAIDALVVSNAR